MFFRKKKRALTFDEELEVTITHLQGWAEFIETEISGEADNVEIPDLGDMKVANARRLMKTIQQVVKFLEPMK